MKHQMSTALKRCSLQSATWFDCFHSTAMHHHGQLLLYLQTVCLPNVQHMLPKCSTHVAQMSVTQMVCRPNIRTQSGNQSLHLILFSHPQVGSPMPASTRRHSDKLLSSTYNLQNILCAYLYVPFHKNM